RPRCRRCGRLPSRVRSVGESLADRASRCHRGRVFRLLGLLGGLSVATDLGTAAQIDESLKRSIVAVRLAKAVGCADREVGDVIYTSLLQHLGCTAYSYELAETFGDDIAATRLGFLTDFDRPRDLMR